MDIIIHLVYFVRYNLNGELDYKYKENTNTWSLWLKVKNNWNMMVPC